EGRKAFLPNGLHPWARQELRWQNGPDLAEAIIAAERMVDDMEKPTRTNKETSSRQQDGGSREQKKRKGKNMLPYQRAGNKPVAMRKGRTATEAGQPKLKVKERPCSSIGVEEAWHRKPGMYVMGCREEYSHALYTFLACKESHPGDAYFIKPLVSLNQSLSSSSSSASGVGRAFDVYPIRVLDELHRIFLMPFLLLKTIFHTHCVLL
ncbi:hypothetical protein SDJN03_18718, partial [Cucurbita argyrosperma subsp. sororia]